MKALSKENPSIGLWLIDANEPTIGPSDVLIKIEKTAICGTDIHIYNWDQWSQDTIKTPMIIGHEYCGRIVEVGKNVTSYKIGQLVSGEGHVICGKCRNCLAGRRHLCQDSYGVGVHRQGAFAEYLSLPESNVWHVDNIDTDVFACFDPLGNATHTALSFDLLGEDVLITGAGPIGIMAAAIAKFAGSRHVVITDINPYRLELAQKVGATTVNIQKNTIKDIMISLGMTEGFDVGLEMSGSKEALNSMVNNMRHGGKIAMLGIVEPNTSIDWNTFVFNGLQMKGIYGREMFETWYKMTSMVQSGLDITPVITHHFHYTEFQKGFDLMRSGKSGKIILEWD